MKIETLDGSWINSRFILTYFIENSTCIACKLYNGDVHGVYKADLVDKSILDKVVNAITNTKLTYHMMYQSELNKKVE